MKKKLAVLLALCLMLGALPLSALAAQYTATLNGQEITLNVDDTTGAVSLPSDLNEHYSVSPETLTVGSFPETQKFTLTYYGEAPNTIEVTGTLVKEEEPFEAITVSFQAGEGASGTMADVKVTTKDEADAWTLPAYTFTAPTDKVFAGWKLSTDTAEEPTLYEEGVAYPLTGNVTFIATWKTSEIKVEDGKLVVGQDAELTEGDTVEVNAGEAEKVTVPEETLTKLKEAKVAAVEVTYATASVTVPVEVLKTGAELGIKASADGTTGVAVTLTGAPNAAQAASGNVLPVALEIKLHITINITNPLYAYKDGSVLRRARFENGAIKTRHLTEFVVLDADSEEAKSVQDEYLPVVESNKSAATFLAEGGDYWFAVFTTKTGDVFASGSQVGPSVEGAMVQGAASLDGGTLNSIFTSGSKIELGGQFGLSFDTVASSKAFTSTGSDF